MNGILKEYLDTYSWGLPCLSAFLLIFSVPPIDLYGLVFIGLVPLFLFTYFAATKLKICIGWGLFTFIYSGYLTHSTLSGFHWLADAELFTFFVQLGGFLAVLVIVGTAVIYAYALGTIKNVFTKPFDIFPVMVCFLCYAVFEAFFFWFLSGFNYGALFFSAQNVPYLLNVIHLGNPMYISIAVLTVNIFIWASILYGMQCMSKRNYLLALLFFIILAFIPLTLQGDVQNLDSIEDVITVAIVQETGRDPDLTFGHIADGEFVFPVLEQHIAETLDKNPDFIIYPFAPWSGVLGGTLDNSHFDRKVITMDDATFSRWLSDHVPEDVVFVSWYTSYRNGHYYNQIGFFKNGTLVSEYSKEKLFPFFDYTPSWALSKGIVSLPYDGTPGTNNVPYTYEGMNIGSLICSEIGDAYATENSAEGNDIIFSLGSETMFSHEIPGEYNARQAQLSAVKHSMPIVRANKFGPSVVYDQNGKSLGRLEYEETGILYVDIPME